MLDIKKLRRLPKGADLSHIQPDLHVLAVPIGALSGHPDNPRLHGDANRKAIAGSLRKYLQRKPVVANMTEQGLLIEAGHGVYGEMLAAGAQYVAVTVVHDDPVHALGYMIADNRTGDLSEDDPEKLAPILRQLLEAGEDVEEIGWDDDAVRELLGDEEKDHGGDDDDTDNDAPVNRADELQKEWSTARGQVWEIPSKSLPGFSHRVVCGNSLDPAVIALVLDGRKPDGVWSDAPYGISIVSVGGGKPMGSVGGGKMIRAGVYAAIVGDDNKDCARQSFAFCYDAFPKALHVWWGANHFSEAFPASSCWIVWDKQNTGNFADAELAWCSDKSAVRIFAHMWNGLMKASERGDCRVHPTQKPIALFEWCAQKYLPGEGKLWLDPFAGSGISLLGAERLGQIACCIELSEAYVAVILQRAKDAGMQPRLLNV